MVEVLWAEPKGEHENGTRAKCEAYIERLKLEASYPHWNSQERFMINRCLKWFEQAMKGYL